MSGPISSKPARPPAASPGKAGRLSKASSAAARAAAASKPAKRSSNSDRQPGQPLIKSAHEKFCQLYASEPNATRAAVGIGATEASAHQIGHRLLKNGEVQARIRELQALAMKPYEIERAEVVGKLADVLRGKAIMNPIQLKAAEILNKMLGFNEPEKVDNKLEIIIRE